MEMFWWGPTFYPSRNILLRKEISIITGVWSFINNISSSTPLDYMYIEMCKGGQGYKRIFILALLIVIPACGIVICTSVLVKEL